MKKTWDNYNISLSLMALNGAEMKKVDGKQCVVIPVEGNAINIDANDRPHLNLVALKRRATDGDSHYLQQRNESANRGQMPVIGHLSKR